MSATTQHRWQLVAPWYRWDRLAAPDPVRADLATRPSLHKFGSDTFMDDFLRDPQATLTFTDADHYHRIESLPPLPPIASGPNAGKTRRMATRQRIRTDMRKLFQPSHARYYLVAIEVHCDAPGFPIVEPSQVAEAGFVIRRRRVELPEGSEKEVAQQLAELTRARAQAQATAQMTVARERTRLLRPVRTKTGSKAATHARTQVTDPRAALISARRQVELARRKLAVWSDEIGVETTTEGWIAGSNGTIGAWAPVPDAPDVIVETTYPMFRLAPSPDDPQHPARQGTIFFGYVPTSSAELQPDGSPRLGDLDVYEVRCYVRRNCGDCPCEPIWSEPSEPFRIASFYDPEGCAQRPISVRLPDFKELDAQAPLRPSVRMSHPEGSMLQFPRDDVPPSSGSVNPNQPEEICFFAIPLITIVAMFLLNLFLPIVMFLFGLWFMLKLKFCIPPSIQLEADLSAELSVVPGGIQFAAEFDIDIDFPGIDQQSLQDTLRDGLNAADPTGTLGTELTSRFTNDAIVTMLAGQAYGTENGGEPSHPTSLPTEAHVTYDEVVHP